MANRSGKAASGDLYARVAEVDEATLARIAGLLELRGRHPEQQRIRREYLDEVTVWSGARVLEVGCGTGVVTRDLAERVGSSGSVLALDPSEVFLAEARRLATGLANVELRLGDAAALELPDNSFDVTVAATVISHVPARDAMLRELARVTRPGGLVLVFDGDYAANQLEHPDVALTQRLLDAWRMSFVNDPRVMRRLIPMLAGARLDVLVLRGYVHVEAGRLETETSFLWPWAQLVARNGVDAGTASQAEISAWLRELEALSERGAAFGSITFFSVVARRSDADS
ncbi:MAG: methyltransferase domain-containing protein [Chloroflexota bacterium]